MNFSCIFSNSGNYAASLSQKAWKLYYCCSHCQCTRPAQMAEFGPWLNSKCSKQWKYDVHVKIWNTVNARSPQVSFKKNNCTEQWEHWEQRLQSILIQNCVSPEQDSVPHKMAKWLQRVSAPFGTQIHVPTLHLDLTTSHRFILICWKKQDENIEKVKYCWLEIWLPVHFGPEILGAITIPF